MNIQINHLPPSLRAQMEVKTFIDRRNEIYLGGYWRDGNRRRWRCIMIHGDYCEGEYSNPVTRFDAVPAKQEVH